MLWQQMLANTNNRYASKKKNWLVRGKQTFFSSRLLYGDRLKKLNFLDVESYMNSRHHFGFGRPKAKSSKFETKIDRPSTLDGKWALHQIWWKSQVRRVRDLDNLWARNNVLYNIGKTLFSYAPNLRAIGWTVSNIDLRQTKYYKN